MARPSLPNLPPWLKAWLPLAPVAAFGGVLVYAALTAVPPGGNDPIERGAWYRVRLAVDRDAPMRFGSKEPVTAEEIARALRDMGYPDIAYLQMGNETTPEASLVDVIARSSGKELSSGLLRVLRRIRLDAASPLAAYPSFLEPFSTSYTYASPEPDLRRAVDYLATYGRVTDVSEGIRILMPDRDPAARLLTARRDVLRRIEQEHRLEQLGPLLAVPGVGGRRRFSGGARVGITQGGFAAIGLFGPLSFPFLSPNDLRDVVDGLTSVGRDLLEVVKTAAPFIQLGMSFVPGVGTVAAAAIGAGISLASGRRISDVFIDAAVGAMPGGAAAQLAVRASAKVVASIAYGDPIDVALMRSFRDGVPEGARAAFDMGYAAAQGKHLQDIVEMGVASLSTEAVIILRAARDGKIDAEALASAAVRSASPDAKSALGVISDYVRQGKNLADKGVLASLRQGFPRQARASLEAAIGHLSRKNPYAFAIASTTDMLPNHAEALLAQKMAARAMRDQLTSATLSRAAGGMAPLAAGAIPGGVDDPRVRAAADSLAALGPKVFARPELYMNLDEFNPDVVKEQENIEQRAADLALIREAAESAEELTRIEVRQAEIDTERARLLLESESKSREQREKVRARWAAEWAAIADSSERLGIPRIG